MKPYDPNGTCPKCACTTVTTRYVASVRAPDMLHRQCTRCAYGWNEAPLDTAPNTDRAQVAAYNTVAHAGHTRFPTRG
jgi:hypothetical protein